MCDELGDDQMMQDYVTEYGSTSLCNVETNAGCSEKEVTYLTKWKEKSQEEIIAQNIRLEAMDGSKMKPDLSAWKGQRIAILKALIKTAKTASDEL